MPPRRTIGMRNLFTLAIVGLVFLVLLGLIVGGTGILIRGGWQFAQELAKRKAEAKPSVPEGPGPQPANVPPPRENRTLLEARQGFETQSKSSTYQRNLDPPEKVPDARLVKYPTAVGDCNAYLSTPRKGSSKLPAVVWAHGGFGGISREDWNQAKPFHEAGFVLMVPSFRGEDSNPGRFEFFYGEVNDLLAAVEYAASLPYVDPDRVYVAGHSAGGTLTLLAAATGTTQVRAFFPIAGLPDVEEFIRLTHGAGYNDASPPFDPNRPGECRLRSALPFTGAIRQRTFYFGALVDDLYSKQAVQMQQKAREAGVPFQKFIFSRANHFNVAEPVIQLLSSKIAADMAGKSTNISFTPQELENLFPR